VTENTPEFNKNALRAIILCILVVYAYNNIFLAPKRPASPPQNAQAPNAQTAQVSPAVVAPVQPSGPATVVGVPQQIPSSHPTLQQLQSAGVTFIESDRIRFAISHLGARAVGAGLTRYMVKQGEERPLDLVSDLEGTAYPLGIYVGNESDEQVRYTLTSVNGAPAASGPSNLRVAPDSKVSVEFKGTLPSGIGISKTLTISSGSYVIPVVVKLDRALPSGQVVWLEWARHFAKESSSRDAGVSHVTYLDGFDKIHHVGPKELSGELRDFGTSRWIALGDLYFEATLVPTVAGRNTMLGLDKEIYTARVAGAADGGNFSIYTGPKDYKTLASVGDFQLERSIDLGWFSFLALPLLWLLHYLYEILGNYGLAIIALTLLVKTVLLPLSKASFESMRAMQELQPEIKALRERVKDPNQLNQETFALYKRKGVNPMGGCLPMFIQIPVFLGLYQALLNSIELRHSPFALWITDLSSPEKLELFGMGIPVMVLLMAASMIIQTWTSPNPSADPAQQKAMMIMPFVFAGMFIIFPMPSGLVLYWLVNNIISIIQQMYMRNTEKGSVYVGTLVASVAIFGVGFILTLI
jgi:YidC/Oxa1 family membrane protein insertase